MRSVMGLVIDTSLETSQGNRARYSASTSQPMTRRVDECGDAPRRSPSQVATQNGQAMTMKNANTATVSAPKVPLSAGAIKNCCSILA